jgi:hypothetical protein
MSVEQLVLNALQGAWTLLESNIDESPAAMFIINLAVAWGDRVRWRPRRVAPRRRSDESKEQSIQYEASSWRPVG